MPYPLAQVTEVSAMQDVARPLRGEATWQHLMHWDPFRIHAGGYKIALCCPSTDTVVAFAPLQIQGTALQSDQRKKQPLRQRINAVTLSSGTSITSRTNDNASEDQPIIFDNGGYNEAELLEGKANQTT